MVKCKECGFESSRLQWTHFKYNCTGRFNNGKEYLKIYPDEKLLDDELRKRTAITEKNLIIKYGLDIGKQKWKEYRHKQSVSNSLEFKKKKYGWSKEDFDLFNKSRAITLELCIKRYGEDIGLTMWEEYCARQAYTNSLIYFQEKYGLKEGLFKYNEINSRKSHSIENIMQRNNCTENEARKILETRRCDNISSLEKIFVDKLEELCNLTLDYCYKTKQYCIYGNDKPNFYDIIHNKKAIEFNGDYWHCNPEFYQENYYHTILQMTAKDIWSKDLKKISLLESERNIPCLVIWEKDFLENEQEVLEKCMNWIKERE